MSFFQDKVILVTGAGGSIGSVLCERLISHKPKMLILFDSSELALYNIDRKLNGAGVPVLGDVSLMSDLDRVFMQYDVDLVFHTAAYKHVTLCEKNIGAAMRVNVEGTNILVRLAKEYGVERLVFISTDKAVRPTCIMGRTKQKAEEIVRKAGYTTIRLGNVWGSNGSAIPLWREQIANGEPVTITDPDATRYFITGWDAAVAIMAAALRTHPGDTFVPNMGEPRKILDIARGLGAREFKYIGLRPGEKLHEELFVGPVPVASNCALYLDNRSAAQTR